VKGRRDNSLRAVVEVIQKFGGKYKHTTTRGKEVIFANFEKVEQASKFKKEWSRVKLMSGDLRRYTRWHKNLK
jgi:dissimilatory sulfite reductase (desulfoviridin) alpha/beta subunit